MRDHRIRTARSIGAAHPPQAAKKRRQTPRTRNFAELGNGHDAFPHRCRASAGAVPTIARHVPATARNGLLAPGSPPGRHRRDRDAAAAVRALAGRSPPARPADGRPAGPARAGAGRAGGSASGPADAPGGSDRTEGAASIDRGGAAFRGLATAAAARRRGPAAPGAAPERRPAARAAAPAAAGPARAGGAAAAVPGGDIAVAAAERQRDGPRHPAAAGQHRARPDAGGAGEPQRRPWRAGATHRSAGRQSGAVAAPGRRT